MKGGGGSGRGRGGRGEEGEVRRVMRGGGCEEGWRGF